MGFELIKPNINFNFLGYRRYAYVLSLLLVLAGVVSLVARGGPKYGVDFAGGMTVQLKFAKAVSAGDIQKPLDAAGLPHLTVQRLGQEKDNSFLISAAEKGEPLEEVRSRVDKALKAEMGEGAFEVQRVEVVGPKVGEDLRAGALNAIFYAVVIIAVYISGRFEQRWMAAGLMGAGLASAMWALRHFGLSTGYLIIAAILVTLVLCWALKLKYALGALVADVHDVFITIGIFSILGIEFDLTIVAALLTILGYSLNDTIIVYDRIRERLGHAKDEPFEKVINDAVNQTLSRTMLTSLITIFTVTALYLFGGSVLKDFALAMIIGIITGTYSSVFVASPILVDLGSGLDSFQQDEQGAAEGGKA
ncbi:protein translocase subunit SecF [Fundidesulfovibrio soli]|uniref:protein translocase subunit SecF n=1 Tax=Fundidesulfovibrio soli TaxID=2922716 RepID=UPI001FAFF1A9|nr:protein translocase subunit SecF [Fundidesulfovibrio soli]